MRQKPQIYSFRVHRNERLTPTTFLLTCLPDRPLSFEAGQFLSVQIPHDGKVLRRAYSIASPPEAPMLQLCVKWIPNGPGSSYLTQLAPGSSFSAQAPYGNFTLAQRRATNLCLVATGTGVAPFRAMLLSREFSANPSRKVSLYLGVRGQEEILFAEDFRGVPGLQWRSAVSGAKRPGPYFAGRVTELIRQQLTLADVELTDFYLCGNGAMISEVKQILAQRGVAKERVHQELFFR